jgi:hypothetical protein
MILLYIIIWLLLGLGLMWLGTFIGDDDDSLGDIELKYFLAILIGPLLMIFVFMMMWELYKDVLPKDIIKDIKDKYEQRRKKIRQRKT